MPTVHNGDTISDATEDPYLGKFAILVSRYNDSITSKLLDGAVETLKQSGIDEEDIEIAWVPGAWELPLAARWFCSNKEFSAVITLGAVIKGDTSHDQHINRAVSNQLMEMGTQFSKPIGFGLLTVNTLDQAIQRAGGTVGNKGQEAAEAVLQMVRLSKNIELAGKTSKKFGF